MSKPEPRFAESSPIQKHLIGRRSRGRVDTKQEIDCQGVEGSFRGRLENVSRAGALISLRHRKFRALADRDLVDVAQQLHDAFPDGVTLQFLDPSILVKARLVRVARALEGGQTVIGCQFVRNLTLRECQLLGIRDSDHGESA